MCLGTATTGVALGFVLFGPVLELFLEEAPLTRQLFEVVTSNMQGITKGAALGCGAFGEDSPGRVRGGEALLRLGDDGCASCFFGDADSCAFSRDSSASAAGCFSSSAAGSSGAGGAAAGSSLAAAST